MTDIADLGYSPNAAYWVDIIRNRRDRYRTELTDAAVLDACGDVAGRRVLDGGAGEGYMGRLLAERGAIVDGLELDPELVDAAIQLERAQQLGIDYLDRSLYNIPADRDTYDLVVLNHVANDLEHLDEAMVEVGRVLRPGGQLTVLCLHPAFYFQRSGLDEDDPAWPELYFTTRPRDQRFNVAGLESPAPVRAWYRPLEDYFAAFAAAGLVVTDLREPHPTVEQMRDPWWQQAWKRPMFTLFVARKL